MLEACEFQYSLQQVLDEEARVLRVAAPVLPWLLGPSATYNLLIAAVGISAPSTFLDSLCLFELWQAELVSPVSALGLCALVLYLELAGDTKALQSLFRVLSCRLNFSLTTVLPLLDLCRKRLLESAGQLSCELGFLERLASLRRYNFQWLLEITLREAVEESGAKRETAGLWGGEKCNVKR